MAGFNWGRKISVTIGQNSNSSNAVKISHDYQNDTRIDFNITKKRSSSPNKGTVTIYNLDPEIRKRAAKEYDRIVLEAGYEDFSGGSGIFGVIIDGFITEVMHRRTGQDIISVFSVSDGGTGFVNATFNKTFQKGSTYRYIVTDIVASMSGVVVGDISDIGPETSIPRARTFHGSGKEIIDEICRNLNCRATVDSGFLNIISNEGGSRSQKFIPKITKDSGLVGSPTITQVGINLRCLINPYITPNSFIDVVAENLTSRISQKKKSEGDDDGSDEGEGSKNTARVIEGASGVFRVNSVSFSGSSHENSFYCNIVGQRSDGYKVYRPETLDRDSTALVTR